MGAEFFSNSDNFYKFLFILGASMVAFAVLSPMEKNNAIELQIIDARAQKAELALRLDDLKKRATNLVGTENSILYVDSLKSELDEIKLLQIRQEAETSRISKLEEQLVPYLTISRILIWVGFGFLLYGLICWLLYTIDLERKEKLGFWYRIWRNKPTT